MGSLPTLQPAFPKVNAMAFPIPLEAPVTMTTGDSTFSAASTLPCSIVATCALIPAETIRAKKKNSQQHQTTQPLFPNPTSLGFTTGKKKFE